MEAPLVVQSASGAFGCRWSNMAGMIIKQTLRGVIIVLIFSANVAMNIYKKTLTESIPFSVSTAGDLDPFNSSALMYFVSVNVIVMSWCIIAFVMAYLTSPRLELAIVTVDLVALAFLINANGAATATILVGGVSWPEFCSSSVNCTKIKAANGISVAAALVYFLLIFIIHRLRMSVRPQSSDDDDDRNY